MKLIDLGEPTSFTMCTWDVLNANANRTRISLRNTRRCSNQEFLLEQLKKKLGWEKPHARTAAKSYDVEGHAEECVGRYCELANRKADQLYNSLYSALGRP